MINLEDYEVDSVKVPKVKVDDLLIVNKEKYVKDDETGSVQCVSYQEALKVVATGAIMGSGPRPTVYMVGFSDGVVRSWEGHLTVVRLRKRGE